MKSDLIDMQLFIRHETQFALLVSVDDDDEREKAVWLPKSQIEVEMKDAERKLAIVTIPSWLVKEKGLDCYVARIVITHNV